MRKFFKRVVFLGLMCCCVAQLSAQEDTPENKNAETGQQFLMPANSPAWDLRALQWAGDRELVRDPFLITYYHYGFDPSLVASDGQYAAQDQNELQTYYDLGLSYRYIAEDYLRRQLALSAGEGIIIEEVDESGLGFKNGFQVGDIVLQVDEKPVDTQYKFVIELANERGSQQVARVRRDGDVVDLTVSLPPAKVDAETRLIIGVYVDEITEVTKKQLGIEGGAAVTQVTEDGPSGKMGVQVHDIITHIDGTLINNLDDLKQIVGNSGGKDVTLDLIRSARKISLTVTPQEVPVRPSTRDFWQAQIVNDLAISNITYPKLSEQAIQWQIAYDKSQEGEQPQTSQEDDNATHQALLKQYEALAEKVEQLTSQLNDIRNELEK